MYNGVINVYKEKGFTSHDVVAKLRGILKQKKIGHTGTLDPDAEGVLPVCLGSGTKLCDMLAGGSKEYVAVLRLGIQTDTQDLSGQIVAQSDVTADKDRVALVIRSFVGASMQIPPMYSALKVNGHKLYELARKGQEVERKPRPIEIYEIEILDLRLPEVTMRVVCSKGTYIRTLCHDIGETLGCHGAMRSLRRTRVSSFGIEDAYTLAGIEQMRDQGRLSELILPVDEMFPDLPVCIVREEYRKLIENGNSFAVNHIKELTKGRLEEKLSQVAEEDGQVRVYDEKHCFYGVYRYRQNEQRFVPVKMFPER